MAAGLLCISPLSKSVRVSSMGLQLPRSIASVGYYRPHHPWPMVVPTAQPTMPTCRALHADPLLSLEGAAPALIAPDMLRSTSSVAAREWTPPLSTPV